VFVMLIFRHLSWLWRQVQLRFAIEDYFVFQN
jgi:hypothetical protein